MREANRIDKAIIWAANRWIDAGYWVLDRFKFEPEPLVEWNGMWLPQWKVDRVEEAELAAYYQAHKDDPDEWDDDWACPHPDHDDARSSAVRCPGCGT